MTKNIIIFCEDALSKAIISYLFRLYKLDQDFLTICDVGGKSIIDSKIQECNRSAKSVPFIVLRDLDLDAPNPCEFITMKYPEPNLYMKYIIAVHEIEAWLLADYINLIKYLNCNSVNSMDDPEMILEPKEYIINICRKSRSKTIKQGMVPIDSRVSQGPLYNDILIMFVESHWNLSIAAAHSRSLNRALKIISAITTQVMDN